MPFKNADTLHNIRKQIDKIDNKIHDLIMDRAIVVEEVAKEKKKQNKDNIVIYRPSREHEILVRLLNRHVGSFPEKILISLWRNLISAYIAIQGELSIFYYGNIEKIVNNHFGLNIRTEKKKTVMEVLKNIKINKSHIAILPFPDIENDWWINLINFNDIFVIGSISDNFHGKPEALILGKQEVEYSSYNTILYLIVLDVKDVKSYVKFLNSKDYIFIADKNIGNNKSIIMFSTKVNSKQVAENKLLTITNSKFNIDINPRNIGVYGTLEERSINE